MISLAEPQAGALTDALLDSISLLHLHTPMYSLAVHSPSVLLTLASAGCTLTDPVLACVPACVVVCCSFSFSFTARHTGNGTCVLRSCTVGMTWPSRHWSVSCALGFFQLHVHSPEFVGLLPCMLRPQEVYNIVRAHHDEGADLRFRRCGQCAVTTILYHTDRCFLFPRNASDPRFLALGSVYGLLTAMYGVIIGTICVILEYIRPARDVQRALTAVSEAHVRPRVQ
jgi:hypothetical protein